MTPSSAPGTPLPVLYRDDWLVAVHKPSGLLVHKTQNLGTINLTNAVGTYSATDASYFVWA
mgnify:CR=1 FL=1